MNINTNKMNALLEISEQDSIIKNEIEIKDNTVVSIRYIMKNNKDEVLENNTNVAAIEYLHGSGSIVSTLESSLTGLRAGQRKSVVISDERLRGTFYFDITVDAVRAATREEIEAGNPLQNEQNKQCGPGCCC